jgi:transposase
VARPSKLTPEIQKRIGDNIALGLTYRLAAESAGVTYKTFNLWYQNGRTEKSGKYYQFYKYIQKRNADAAKVLLERINEAARSGDTQMCTWILERRFASDFGRRVYRKTNLVADNLNQNVNVEIKVQDADAIREEILAKFDRVEESNESLTS